MEAEEFRGELLWGFSSSIMAMLVDHSIFEDDEYSVLFSELFETSVLAVSFCIGFSPLLDELEHFFCGDSSWERILDVVFNIQRSIHCPIRPTEVRRLLR